MKTIDVQFYGREEITTVLISSIKYIQDEDMGDTINAILYFMDGTSQILNINREKVKNLIDR
ncbi:MAG: hypothetical protein COZ16_05985 [Flavobacteriaceae bacterium CG_4_10_14_3_um_filter_31_253]|nr:MAG: hypothetical protein COW43_08880 [Flavobacteriaceae bacterium CG17_big_fil_post_rev_8_21_14_2_50_31_13]PIX14889.1 MAG: hypothetical protein COZ74_01765 [Flavobacteriaceae bacterium CG_4_8_14_3_um_filter_31_8]PIY15059.1 MAG: hypothetical protein COZ16_05985 [Flavobacteriaceae bacterium CG_4_10_14_3_um_filter_31_253]PIZ12400.1 MAG: hypothetical protein COY55_00055 [Flavobacteriaceae bacterium CG_4_10_14_0_8_um_filter_31_99]PJC10080.1 MAG: hypothetical protein CO067_06545 [Flavobacteriacea